MDFQAKTPFIRFNLGDLELTIVSDGYQTMKPAHPIFGPYTAPYLVRQLLKDNCRPMDYVDLDLQILLIRKGETVIMIDSGLGKIEQTGGHLVQALLVAGFQTTQITDIILTHAHTDHIGGLTDEQGKHIFPNAQIYITQIEFEFWTMEVPDFTKSAMKNNSALTTSLASDIKKRLQMIQPKLRFVEANALLFNCIQLIAAPGHTPGHIILRIFSGDQQLIHIADTIHSEVLLFRHPEWGFIFDVDFEQAIATRTSILKTLEQNKTLTLAYHLPWPGLGYVRYKNSAFEWEYNAEVVSNMV